jgi:hypothetical protein
MRYTQRKEKGGRKRAPKSVQLWRSMAALMGNRCKRKRTRVHLECPTQGDAVEIAFPSFYLTHLSVEIKETARDRNCQPRTLSLPTSTCSFHPQPARWLLASPQISHNLYPYLHSLPLARRPCGLSASCFLPLSLWLLPPPKRVGRVRLLDDQIGARTK